MRAFDTKFSILNEVILSSFIFVTHKMNSSVFCIICALYYFFLCHCFQFIQYVTVSCNCTLHKHFRKGFKNLCQCLCCLIIMIFCIFLERDISKSSRLDIHSNCQKVPDFESPCIAQTGLSVQTVQKRHLADKDADRTYRAGIAYVRISPILILSSFVSISLVCILLYSFL
jgi:hypothetical protein